MKQETTRLHILCVSGSEKGTAFIRELLRREEPTELTVADTAAEASAMLKSKKFDICMINAPLSDANAAKLANTVAKQSHAAVLLFVKAEDYEQTVAMTAQNGIFTIEKPNSARFFQQATDLIFTVKKREKAEEEKILVLESKIDEIKIVNRAKLVLMQYLKMDEAKAHRYIEKQAMDRRISRREVAEIIISTYEY